ncbi:hypothetical protein AMJ39_09575 [candidate division TA06 bacterium DG_24]|uniref:Gingipain domain-containing protein n=1 Tax=candidate division TA06 bacterium DG_24 TaxID=1703770 RepID=A0A0S7WPS8_UNCT6|nr:MAG: hypothetical protein AMJ39_09575 [candidate division TA06 bacterium DG_24]
MGARVSSIGVTCVIATVFYVALPAAGGWIRFEDQSAGELPRVAVDTSDQEGMTIGLSVPGIEESEVERAGEVYRRFEIPGGAETGEIGCPSLPAITRLVAIPWRGGAQVVVRTADSLVIEDVDIAPVEDWRVDSPDAGEPAEPYFDATVYGRDELYPPSVAELGEPAIMRDLRLVQLVVYPLRYNPVRRELRVYQNLEVDIVFTDEGANEKAAARARPSAAFEDLYRSVVQYISDAYFTWEVPPEYVLLVGDEHMGWNREFPTFTHSGDCTDLPYTLLEGDDYFPELLIGRMSIDSEEEAEVVVAKTLGYERNPYMGSTAWYRRGLVVATTEDALSCKTTKRHVAYKLMENGFADVDSVWHPPTSSAGPIESSINEGVSFVNYRGLGSAAGWTLPSFKVGNVANLTNGWKQPIMTSIICATCDFASWNYDPCFGEAWIRFGTTTNPKGGPVFFGPTDLFTHTKWNNSIDGGVYWGIFDDGLVEFAQAMFRGKIELYNSFPNNTYAGGTVEHYFHIYNVLGDPELNMWTTVPEALTVDHAASVPLGTNYLVVDVQAGSAPGEGALICLCKEGEIFAREYGDADGSAVLTFEPGTAGDLFVTVTRRNGIPYLASVSVNQANVFAGYDSHVVDDDNVGGSHGNGDGYVNPGETIEMPTWLRNWGTQTASSVTGYLTSDDPWVTVVDGEEAFGTIGPGSTAQSQEDFDFQVSTACTSGHLLQFVLRANAGGEDYYTIVEIPVRGAHLVYSDHSIIDGGSSLGNGILDPGETADMVVTLLNEGLAAVTGVEATLVSTDLWFTIGQAVGTFGSVAPGGTASNSSSPFEITADPLLRDGYEASLTLEITGDGGYEASVPLIIDVGTTGTGDPMGPDEYGYFAYDNTDTGYDEAPAYAWIEIDPSYGGSGTPVSLYGDEGDVDTLSLPFTFRYYGGEYDEISICSNGFAALGETWVAIPRNWGIPAALGPDAMLAAFWDDLRPDGGGVYTYYDSTDHRFIIEWSRYENRFNGYEETFEIVLYDPAYHRTATGDGEILYQYETINNVDSNENYATVGIEEPAQWYGLQYTYANHYAPEAPSLVSGRAIKFTTDSPHLPAIGLYLDPDATIYHRGETLGYTAYVANNTSSSQSVVGRADVRLPNGNPYSGNPVVGPRTVNLSSGQSVHPHLTHHLPQAAPFGAYIYTVTVENGEGDIIARDSFAFTVVP